MVVAAIMLTTLFVSSGTAVTQTDHTINITIYKSARPDLPLQGARIIFTDVHQGTSEVSVTDVNGQVRYHPSSQSYFSLLINATGYYDYQYLSPSNKTEYIRFDGTADVNLRGVILAQLPQTTMPVELRLEGSTHQEVAVRLTYMEADEQTAYAGNITSNTIIYLQPGNYRLAYRGLGIQPDMFTFSVKEQTNVTLNIRPSAHLDVSASMNGAMVVAEAYLVSKVPAELGRMVVLPTAASMGNISFDAYPGEFYLIVAAPGATALQLNVTLPSASVVVRLAPETPKYDTISTEVIAWDTISFEHLRTLPGGISEKTLQLGWLPSIRMQLDLSPSVGGNRNGIVDYQEVANYTRILRQMGPNEMTTEGLLYLDGTAFASDPNYLGYDPTTVNLENTPVWSMASYSKGLRLNYTMMAAGSPVSQEGHLIRLNPQYNETLQRWAYSISLPEGYVLLGPSVQKDPTSIAISGYTRIWVYPPMNASSYNWPAQVLLPFSTVKSPSATASLTASPATYRLDQTTFIARSGVEVELSAAGSFDPNGNPLTYIWDLGDGGRVTTMSERLPHTYSTPTLSLTATLTVQDVSMRNSTTSITIKVDGVPPTPILAVNGTTPGSVIEVDQMAAVPYSATASYDRIFNESVPQGRVVSYRWDFGDGTVVTGPTQINHQYLTPGWFWFNLTVTDAIGRQTSAIYQVHVRDTQPPTVIVDIHRAADGSNVSGSAIIDDLLSFEGSRSTDPSGIVSYVWSFGDGSSAEGVNVSHAYSSLGTFSGRLTCVDGAGLSAYQPFTLTILSKPSPLLRITSISLAPSQFTEKESGSIEITVTNQGSLRADNLTTVFYLVQGSRTILVTVLNASVGGVPSDHLDIGQTGTVRASLSFSTSGSYHVVANISAVGSSDEAGTDIQVNASPWQSLPLILLAVAVVAIVIGLLYVRSQRAKKERERAKAKGKKKR
jgi:PKD repeat protein